MRIQFKTEGGVAFIPHLSQLATVDSNDLSNEQREELRRLITEARFFELPQRLGSPPPGAADYQQHVITVEEDGHRHTVEFTDLADNQALMHLLAFLRALRSKP